MVNNKFPLFIRHPVSGLLLAARTHQVRHLPPLPPPHPSLLFTENQEAGVAAAKFESPVTGAERMENQVLSSGTLSDFSGMAGQVDAAGEKAAAKKADLEAARPGFEFQP